MVVRTGTEAIAEAERLLARHGAGMPSGRSLLLDVRGMRGPADLLCLHAAFRALPIPHGVLRWVDGLGEQGRQRLLSPETREIAVRAARSGNLMHSTLEQQQQSESTGPRDVSDANNDLSDRSRSRS